MKKYWIAVPLVAALLMAGCGQKSTWTKTMATPMPADAYRTQAVSKKLDTFSIINNVCSYLNDDHTWSVYVYSAHVEEEAVFEETEDGFEHTGQYVRETLPDTWSAEGAMTVSGNGQYIRITPAGSVSSAGKAGKEIDAFGRERACVVYPDAFGPGIDYVCTPTAYGLNTEIILRKPGDKTTFDIQVQLPTLVPDTQSPDYIAFRQDKDTNDVQSILYTPVAVDKRGSWSYENDIKLIDKDSGTNTYRLSYIIDAEFLKTASYPVRLNQSLHLYKAKQPDTSAYSDTGDVAGHYLSPYMLMGDSTPKGEGWTYIRYETLNKLAIDPDDVIAARYVFHNLLDLKSPMTVGAYAVTADWCSINTRWYNRPEYDTRPMSQIDVQKRGDYALDVTTLVKEMLKNIGQKDALYSVNNSFMIRSDTPDSSALFASGDGGLFSPMLEIVLKM